MEGDESDFTSNIFYFFREKSFNSMILVCKEGIAKFKGNESFKLYHALALLLNNRIEESINELNAIKKTDDMKLACVIAIMYAHRLLRIGNKELFQTFDSQIRENRKTAEAIDYFYSSFVLFVLNKLEKALDYVDKAIHLQRDLFSAVTLKGWILIYLKRSGHKISANIQEVFETSLKSSKRDLDATIGLSESLMLQNKFDDAFATVNRAIVRFPTSKLPLVLKMKIQFAAQEWDQFIETMNLVIKEDSKNLEALKLNIVVLLCHDANYEEAVPCIKNYINTVESKEYKNCQLLLENAQLFSKICGRHGGVLKETYRMVERAVQINSESIDCIVELGNQCLLQENFPAAKKYFKTASKLDETLYQPLLGLTLCELREHGTSEQITKQIDFLLGWAEAQNSARLYLVRAKAVDNTDETLIFLKKACDLQLSSAKPIAYSDLYLQQLNPDLMLDIIKEYLGYISSTPDLNSQGAVSVSSAYSTVQNVLKVVTNACSGLYEAFYLLAKVQFLTGDTNNAMENLDKIVQKIDDDLSSEAYLLMAQIQVKNGHFERAAQSLEFGLSRNFNVRDNPIYHYIRAMVDKNTNNLQDTIKSLMTAQSLMLLKTDGTRNKWELSLTEKASIYIELIEIHNAIEQGEEATKLLELAIEEFRGTPEEARILIVSADHAIRRNNYQAAIELLGKVKPNESYYMQARTKLANLLLTYQQDKYAYLECYQQMVDESPKPERYLLLGDAYMTILEPDDALECYNQALQQNPSDPYLTSKMGKALVETHYFAKAVAFYKEAIKSTQNFELKLQLAELHMQLKEYDKAQILLMTEIETENSKNVDDLTFLQYKTKLLTLLAQNQEKSGNLTGALATLKDARECQSRIRKRFVVERGTVPPEELKLLVEVSVKLAEISTLLKNTDQAIQFYKDAVEVSSNDTTILAALAKLYLQINVLESCQQICTNILRIDPENETASVLMADIAFRKIDFDMALFHFTHLINKQPNNWVALARLVEIMRRTGNLNEVPELLANAEKSIDNPTKNPGFLFATALYQWYSGNLNGALRNFNGARQDPDWGQLALCNMIEICLNPDDELLGDQFIDSEDSEYRDSRSMALKTADRLLKELKYRLETYGQDLLKYKLLINFRLLATQDKQNIERALEEFLSIGSQNVYKDLVGPILGMATAYTMLKQSQRAKNQLKRVAKIAWNFEDADYLERCWLLLSDYYIQSSKFDVAADLLNKVVQHNKACSKAYEYLGLVCEKEQRYRDAVQKYESAWRFSGKSNPGIGFKLAYNLMKSKSYADAVDVGMQVLNLNPDYPKIRKDILDKCINNLRM